MLRRLASYMKNLVTCGSEDLRENFMLCFACFVSVSQVALINQGLRNWGADGVCVPLPPFVNFSHGNVPFFLFDKGRWGTISLEIFLVFNFSTGSSINFKVNRPLICKTFSLWWDPYIFSSIQLKMFLLWHANSVSMYLRHILPTSVLLRAVSRAVLRQWAV